MEVMKFDQLPLEQQKTASYCHACGEVKPNHELGLCVVCGYRLCLTKECSGGCLCDDARKGFADEAEMKRLSFKRLFKIESDPERFHLLSRVPANYESGFSN
jgi:hypothetical protein